MKSIKINTSYDWIHVYGAADSSGGVPIVSDSAENIEVAGMPEFQDAVIKCARMTMKETGIVPPENVDRVLPVFLDEHDSTGRFADQSPKVLMDSNGAITMGRRWEDQWFATTHFGVFFREMAKDPNYLGLVINKPLTLDDQSGLAKYQEIDAFIRNIKTGVEVVSLRKTREDEVTLDIEPLYP